MWKKKRLPQSQRYWAFPQISFVTTNTSFLRTTNRSSLEQVWRRGSTTAVANKSELLYFSMNATGSKRCKNALKSLPYAYIMVLSQNCIGGLHTNARAWEIRASSGTFRVTGPAKENCMVHSFSYSTPLQSQPFCFFDPNYVELSTD